MGADSYHSVTRHIADQLCQIVGERHVLYGDPDLLAGYAHDEVAGDEYAHLPDAVVKPASADEIGRILRLANQERVPVTPRGAGTGLSGGAVPVYGGIVLSLERMNRILEIDRQNMVVVVQPGVVTNDINAAVRPYGLFYAGYPMSVESCSIGGNVAENAGGGRAIKYGVTGRYVLGMEAVLPTGEIVRLGGKRVKDVTGYDLVHLLVGSEGTLGIVTEITLQLRPLPTARVVLVVPFADVPTAIAAVPRLMTEGRVIPSSIEFMDRLSAETAYRHLGETPPRADLGALLLIELDGSERAQVEAEADRVVDLCLAAGAMDVFVGNTPGTEARMWHPREVVAEAFKVAAPIQMLEDIVVPPANIPALMVALQRLADEFGVPIPCYGHAGDGNLHATPIKPVEMPIERWQATTPLLLAALYTAVGALGGTISGEHGIGSKRAAYLPLALDPVVIALQRRIKAAFDPLNILNPGKIFPHEPADRTPGKAAR